MARFLIEGSCDGDLFAEVVEADTLEEAEDAAIDRLCDAWGHERGPDTTLDDLGDSAIVTAYSAEMYARDAGPNMLAALRDVAALRGVSVLMGDWPGVLAKVNAAIAEAEGRA